MPPSRPPARPPPPPQDGNIGPYRLANRIAVGGMAEVFRALDQPPAGAPRAVVIKRMLPALAADEECRAMFEKESGLVLRIAHPNVVQVLDTGQDGDIPYLVLEYVFGVDLWRISRHLTRTGKRLRLPVAVYVASEILAGLEAVHAVTDDDGRPLQIVHRDVSPSNVFLSVHGDVKLGDLGIAGAAMRETHRSAPRSPRAKGKLGYLAPEQVAGEASDQRADIFAAAVIVAELLMGRPLFTGGGEIGILLAIRDADVRSFREMAADLPVALGSALLSALERSPEARTDSARELRAQIAPFVGDDVNELRNELGTIVASVVAETEEGDLSMDRRALAKTVEGRASWLEEQANRSHTDGGVSVATDVGEAAIADGAEQIDQRSYRLHSPHGRTMGPLRYADLIQAIATGAVGIDDRICLDDGEPRPLHSYAHLVRHLPPSSRTPTILRRTRMVETSELYDLSRGGMLVVLGEALIEGHTGLLLCHHEDVRKEIYLEAGHPVFVVSNRATDLLGEYLVSQGLIDRRELDRALAVMPRFEGRLGETLAALGLMEPVQLVRHIEAQVRELLLDTFRWSAGRAAFYGAVEPPEGRLPIRLDPWDVLDTGAALRIECGLEEARFGARGAEAHLVATPLAQRLLSCELPPDLSLLLATLDSPQPYERLAAMLVVGNETKEPTRVRRLVTVLLALEAVCWVE